MQHSMMALLFTLFYVAMLLALFGKTVPGQIVFGLAFALSLFWFAHHATDALTILL